MEPLLERAAADYRQALRLDNRLAIAYSSLIYIATAQSDRDAITAIRRAGLDAAADDLTVHAAYLWSLQPKWGGNLADLRAYLSALQDRYADDPWASFLKGYGEALTAEMYWARGKYEKALQHIGAAIDAHENANRLSTRAGIYISMDREDEALADIDKALTIEPDSSEYLSLKSKIYWSRKDFVITLSLIDRAVALDPLNPKWLDKRIRLRGIVARRFRKDGDVARAREYIAKAQRDIEAAMAYGANDAGVWKSISWFHVMVIKDDKKTRAALETAISLNPKDWRLWQWHLNVLFTLKDCRALDAASGYLQACRQDENCRLDTGMSNYVTEKMAWCRNGGTEPPQTKRRDGLMGMLHTCHELFEGMEKSVALEECRRRAETGDAGAQFDMGVLSNVGKFVAKDKVAAAAWMRKAAAQGDMDAHAYLGVFNLRGIGMDQDVERGIRMLREAAAAESLVGMNSLARSYYEGLGVEQDKKEAHRILQVAVAKGSANAERAIKMWFGFTRY
jgi:TPR repeat protein